MKKLVIIPAIFMITCSLCVKAQNNQQSLNQVELMKKFNGTWQSARGIDTIYAFEMHEYDNALLQTYYRTIRGLKRLIYTVSYSYDPNSDKFNGFLLYPDGRAQTYLVRFSSDKNSDFERVEDLKTNKSLSRNSVSLEDPDHMTINYYNSEKVRYNTTKWVRTSGSTFMTKSDSKVDQLASMQVLIGKWQTDSAKDTMFISEWQQIGNVFTNITTRVIKGVKSVYYTQNVSYSAKEGIFRSFVAYPAGRYITYLAAFETNKKWKGAFVRNFNPDEVASTWEANFPDPGQMIITYFTKDGVKEREYKWDKVK